MNLTRTTSLAAFSDLPYRKQFHRHSISGIKLTSFEKAFLDKLSHLERPKIRVKFCPEDKDVNNADFLIEPFKTQRITGRKSSLETVKEEIHTSRRRSLPVVTEVLYEQHLPPFRNYSRIVFKRKKTFDYTLISSIKARATMN